MLAELHNRLTTDRAGPEPAAWNARPSFQIAQAADTGGGLNSNGIDNLPQAGRVAALTGEAVILRAGGGREPAAAGMILHQGDVVLTGQGARAVIARPDGTVQSLGGGERLTVAAPPRREQSAPEETPPEETTPETPAGEEAAGEETAGPDPAGNTGEAVVFIPAIEPGIRPWTGLWQSAEGPAHVANLTVGDGGGVGARGTTAADDTPPSRSLSGSSTHNAPPATPDPPSQDPPSQDPPAGRIGPAPVINSYQPVINPYQPVSNSYQTESFPLSIGPAPVINSYQPVSNPYQTESFPLSNVRNSSGWTVGGGGDDTWQNNLGSDRYDGNTGRDTVIYRNPITDYRFDLNAAGRLTVTDANPANGNEGVDTLVNVEVLRFAGVDYTLNLGTAADGSPAFTLSAPGRNTIRSPDPTVAEYTGPLADYAFGYDAAGRLTVTDTTPANGNDGGVTAASVETLRFAETDGSTTTVHAPAAGGGDITGTGGDDLILAGFGDRLIDGGGGRDTVIFTGPLADYTFGHDAAGRVTATDGNGTQTLDSIETLRFAGGDYTLIPNVNRMVGNEVFAVAIGTAADDISILAPNGMASGDLGDDVFHNAFAPGTLIRGGPGIDTAVVTESNARLDVNSNIDDIEAIQLTGGHTLAVTPIGVQGAISGLGSPENPLTGQANSLIIHGQGRVDLEADFLGVSFTRPAGNPTRDLDPDGDGTATSFSVYQATTGGVPVLLYIEETIAVS